MIISTIVQDEIVPYYLHDNPSIIVQYLPLFLTLMAGIFAIYQLRLNHNANYRLKWIEGFRNAVSILISEVNDYTVTLTKIVIEERKNISTQEIKDADTIRFFNTIKSSTRYFNEVLLFLDPNNKEHQEIIKCINVIELACKDSSPKIEDFNTFVGRHFDLLIKLAQAEISKQWKRSRTWKI